MEAFLNWINSPEVTHLLKNITEWLIMTCPSIVSIISVVVAVVKGNSTLKALADKVASDDRYKVIEDKLKEEVESNAQLKLMIADLLTTIKGIEVKVEQYEQSRIKQSN